MPALYGRMPARVASPPKIADSFYHSREWKSLVAQVKAARGNWCERCGSRRRVIADHKIERRDGGADLDPANIELLCHAHHQAKTAAARAARARSTGGGG